MSLIEKLTARVSDLEKRLANVCRIAQVAAVDVANARLDISFEGNTIKGIPFLTMRAGADKTYWLPSVGELGTLLAPSGDLANAIFLPGIFYTDFPATDISETKSERIFRDGMKEEIDTDAHSRKYTSGNSERFVDRDKIEDKKGTSVNTIDNSETKLERTAGKIKVVVGSNMNELTAILANIIGAQLFPTGITTLQSPVGPVMFAPAPSPVSAPSPPAGSEPDGDGNVTKTPASTISGVSVRSGSSLSFTIPTIPVTTPAGPGSTVPTLVTISPTGTVTLQFPARSL